MREKAPESLIPNTNIDTIRAGLDRIVNESNKPLLTWLMSGLVDAARESRISWEKHTTWAKLDTLKTTV